MQILKHIVVAGAASIRDDTPRCLLDITTGGGCIVQQPRNLHAATGDILDKMDIFSTTWTV
jgi:hypothetical protein